VRVVHRRALAEVPAEHADAVHAGLVDEYETAEGGLARALALGVVDEIIDPAHTRHRLASALVSAPVRRGQHRNTPL